MPDPDPRSPLLAWMVRLSYSSELGAATAYAGHAAACRDPAHAAVVARVRVDELHHREQLGAWMTAQGLAPFPPFEWFFLALGTVVGFGCRFWGDRSSAFGASLFEINGVSEYARLRVLAERARLPELADAFETMRVQEQAHRDIFRELARTRADLDVVRAIEARSPSELRAPLGGTHPTAATRPVADAPRGA